MFVDSADRTPHYSLRKLSVGVASVLLSTTLWMGANGSVAHADTINDTTVAVKASSSAENKSDPSKTQMASKDQKQTQTAESTSQASVASAEKQNGEAQSGQGQDAAAVATEANQAENKQVQKGDSANVEAQPTTASDAQADVAKQEPAAATEGQTNGSANAGAAIDATTKAKKDSANPEANSSDAATEDAKNESTTTLDVSQAFKTSTAAKVTKKMVMSSLASAAKLADQYDAKGATKTVIYGQTIDPNSLIANFSSLPTGTKASAANLDSIKTKQGRSVVPVTVTYSDGSSDAANAIVWVTPKGTTALAKSVSLHSNADTDKPEITVGINKDVPLPFTYTGTAVVNGSDIAKGAKIYFSTLAEKYDECIGFSPTSAINVIDSDNDIIGNLYISNAQNLATFMLNVTTNKKYEGDVTIRFDAKNEGNMLNVWQAGRNLHSIYLVNTDEPYDYSGTVVQKRWLHAVGQDDKEYTINRTVSPVEAGMTRGPNGSGVIPSAIWQRLTIDPQLVGYQGSTANPKNTTITSAEAWKIADEIWKGKGKVKPADLPKEANWHEIFQVTTNVSELPDNFNIGNWNLEGDVQAATADGQPSNQIFHLSTTGNLFNAKVVHVADNLSIKQLYDKTSSGQIGYSKQANGTFLICFNLSANDTAPKDKAAYAKTIIRDMGRNGNIALSKDYDQITKATADFYANNVVPNFAAWWQDFWISVNNAYTSDRKWIMTDVTLGHPAYSVTSTYTAGTASADGESRLTNTAYFVDDSQNQAIVGGLHQISGKKGDTVLLNLTVPSGYILASGQSLPTSYTFTGNDSDIVIHLKHAKEPNQDTTTVKETIHYNYADGSKAAEDHSESVTLSRTGTKDKVTGNTVWNDWSTAKISSVTSPTIPGYTADKKEIDAKSVNGPHDEFVETVTYTADTQKATVTYVDDTTNTTLETKKLSGDSGADSGYTTKSSIKTYKSKGYEVVSDDTNGADVVFDHDSSVDQSYFVHLKHAHVTITPNDKNPVNPGDKINPNDPNSPVYGDDVKRDNLAKDAKQTVHYEGAGTDTPADSVTTVKDAFTRTVTYDKVTGKSTTSGWSKPKTTFDKVKTPVVKGYTANKKQAGGLTATPDHPEVSDTVVYTPSGSIVPVDPNGNPIPGTNPVPYETDPNDPTKVVNGKVPEVPGWTPKNGKPGDPVVPTDPTKDTKVPYVHTKVVDDKVPEVPSWTPKNGKPGDLVKPSDPTKDTEVPDDHTMTPGETTATGKVEGLPEKPAKSAKAPAEKLVKTPVKAPKAVKEAAPAEMPAQKAAQAQDQLPQTGEDNSKAAFGLGLASILGGIGILGAFKRKKKEN